MQRQFERRTKRARASKSALIRLRTGGFAFEEARRVEVVQTPLRRKALVAAQGQSTFRRQTRVTCRELQTADLDRICRKARLRRHGVFRIAQIEFDGLTVAAEQRVQRGRQLRRNEVAVQGVAASMPDAARSRSIIRPDKLPCPLSFPPPVSASVRPGKVSQPCQSTRSASFRAG